MYEWLYGTFLIVFLGSLGLIVYFWPTFYAAKRQHKNLKAILVLNLFLGWTLIGWVAAFVWATFE